MITSSVDMYEDPQHVDLEVTQFRGSKVIETIYGGIVRVTLKGAKGNLDYEDLLLLIPDQDLGVRRYPKASEILGVVATASIASWTGDSGDEQKVMAIDTVKTQLWAVILGGVKPPDDIVANFLLLRLQTALMSGILKRISYRVTVLTKNVDTPGNKIFVPNNGWDGSFTRSKKLAEFP